MLALVPQAMPSGMPLSRESVYSLTSRFLQEWLKNARTCPVCRARVESGHIGQASHSSNTRSSATSAGRPWVVPPLSRGRSLAEIRPSLRHPPSVRDTVSPLAFSRTAVRRNMAFNGSHTSSTPSARDTAGNSSGAASTATSANSRPAGSSANTPPTFATANTLSDFVAAAAHISSSQHSNDTNHNPTRPARPRSRQNPYSILEDANEFDNPWSYD